MLGHQVVHFGDCPSAIFALKSQDLFFEGFALLDKLGKCCHEEPFLNAH